MKAVRRIVVAMLRVDTLTAEIFTHSPEVIADIAGVDLSTARRWKRRRRLPPTALRLLAIALLGDMTALGWKRWRIVADRLVSPEGWEFTPGQVMSLPLVRAQLAAALSEIRRFKGLEEQPTMNGEQIDDLYDLVARSGRVSGKADR